MNKFAGKRCVPKVWHHSWVLTENVINIDSKHFRNVHQYFAKLFVICGFESCCANFFATACEMLIIWLIVCGFLGYRNDKLKRSGYMVKLYFYKTICFCWRLPSCPNFIFAKNLFFRFLWSLASSKSVQQFTRKKHFLKDWN